MIGKAIAQAGKAEIPATFTDGPPPAGDLDVALDADDSPPVTIPVQDDDQRTPTTLTQACGQAGSTTSPMVVSGHLEGAPSGSTVTVTYVHQASQQTRVAQVTTDTTGDWRASATPGPNGSGVWRATASYAGNDQYRPSQGDPCDFNVG